LFAVPSEYARLAHPPATALLPGGGPQLLYHAFSVKLYLLVRRESGQTMAEYAIVLAVISIAIIAAIGLLGGNISKALSSVASKV
jgi:Flp pilus assembly pilin Flp